MKGRVIRKGHKQATNKSDRYIAIANSILAQNRRLTSPAQIKADLKKEFDDAQTHLNDCNADPEKWQHAKPEICRQHYRSETAGHAGVAYMQGLRPTMEDTHIATTLILNCSNKTHHVPLYGIFDGHGGEACAQYLAQQLPTYLKGQLEMALAHCPSPKDEEAAIFNVLKLAFVNLGAAYRQSTFVDGGSTANIAFIYKKAIWVANVGDTRAILAIDGQAIALSEDAKPAMEKYKRGVENRHCVVIDINGIPRVEGVMAVARAVGHNEIASGISPRAKVIKYSLAKLPKESNYLVIACDGLWDVTTSNQVAQTVSQLSNRTPEEIAVHLIRKGFEAESTDNISALVATI